MDADKYLTEMDETSKSGKVINTTEDNVWRVFVLASFRVKKSPDKEKFQAKSREINSD